MSFGAATAQDRKAIAGWPSARLLQHAEANPGDRDLLEFILTELRRRGVEVAQAAAERVADLLRRNAEGPASEAASPEMAAAIESAVAVLAAKLQDTEERLRFAEMRAVAAERLIASEGLAPRGLALLRRVHLADTAPGWMVDAARRAFRLRFHPDRFADPIMKARAEETFKEAEEIFRHITPGHG